jgi:hypothetical protein
MYPAARALPDFCDRDGHLSEIPVLTEDHSRIERIIDSGHDSVYRQ